MLSVAIGWLVASVLIRWLLQVFLEVNSVVQTSMFLQVWYRTHSGEYALKLPKQANLSAHLTLQTNHFFATARNQTQEINAINYPFPIIKRKRFEKATQSNLSQRRLQRGSHLLV